MSESRKRARHDPSVPPLTSIDSLGVLAADSLTEDAANEDKLGNNSINAHQETHLRVNHINSGTISSTVEPAITNNVNGRTGANATGNLSKISSSGANSQSGLTHSTFPSSSSRLSSNMGNGSSVSYSEMRSLGTGSKLGVLGSNFIGNVDHFLKRATPIEEHWILQERTTVNDPGPNIFDIYEEDSLRLHVLGDRNAKHIDAVRINLASILSSSQHPNILGSIPEPSLLLSQHHQHEPEFDFGSRTPGSIFEVLIAGSIGVLQDLVNHKLRQDRKRQCLRNEMMQFIYIYLGIKLLGFPIDTSFDMLAKLTNDSQLLSSKARIIELLNAVEFPYWSSNASECEALVHQFSKQAFQIIRKITSTEFGSYGLLRAKQGNLMCLYDATLQAVVSVYPCSSQSQLGLSAPPPPSSLEKGLPQTEYGKEEAVLAGHVLLQSFEPKMGSLLIFSESLTRDLWQSWIFGHVSTLAKLSKHTPVLPSPSVSTEYSGVQLHRCQRHYRSWDTQDSAPICLSAYQVANSVEPSAWYIDQGVEMIDSGHSDHLALRFQKLRPLEAAAHLFATASDHSNYSRQTVATTIERDLRRSVAPITVISGYLDWQVLRQYLVNETVSRKLILHDKHSQQFVTNTIREGRNNVDVHLAAGLLVNDWLHGMNMNNRRSEITHTRELLKRKPWCRGVFQTGLLVSHSYPYLGSTPDLVALVAHPQAPSDEGELAPVCITRNRLGTDKQRSATPNELIADHVGSTSWWSYIPEDCRTTLLHQATVLDTDYALFIQYDEIDVFRAVIVNISKDAKQAFLGAVHPFADLCKWAIDSKPGSTPAVPVELRSSSNSLLRNFRLWRALNDKILFWDRGQPLMPVSSFASLAQCCYEGAEQSSEEVLKSLDALSATMSSTEGDLRVVSVLQALVVTVQALSMHTNSHTGSPLPTSSQRRQFALDLVVAQLRAATGTHASGAIYSGSSVHQHAFGHHHQHHAQSQSHTTIQTRGQAQRQQPPPQQQQQQQQQQQLQVPGQEHDQGQHEQDEQDQTRSQNLSFTIDPDDDLDKLSEQQLQKIALSEAEEIMNKAPKRGKARRSFFNRPAIRAIRRNRGLPHDIKKIGFTETNGVARPKMKTCVVCGGQATSVCSLCKVPLHKVFRDQEEQQSCFMRWHSSYNVSLQKNGT